MTARLMGDAIHDDVATIPGDVQLVAGYDTGTADIKWTAADWARYPGLPHVHIDQAFGGPVYSATVQDVETGAWSPADVPGWQAKCTAPRPTVYCNQSTLPAVLATGWRGNLWLAIPGWLSGDPLPPAPGCTVVAVQSVFAATYDLSYVLDPSWPLETTEMQFPGIPGIWLKADFYIDKAGTEHLVGLGTDYTFWHTSRPSGGTWAAPVALH